MTKTATLAPSTPSEMQTALINALREVSLLKALSEQEMQHLASRAELKEVGKFHFVYLADEPSEYVYFLVRGNVKTGLHTPDGRELVKAIMHPTQIFGELGLTGERSRAEFACTMGADSAYIAVRTEDFRRLVNSNFQLAQSLLIEMGNRLRRAERQWESLILKDVRTRIVDFIKESAEVRGRQVGYETLFKHSLTQQDIASLVERKKPDGDGRPQRASQVEPHLLQPAQHPNPDLSKLN